MAGIKKHGGEHAGASDKGAFFKFKSKDDAENFKSYTNKCPHRSCDAEHVTEAVEYKGIGTDVVDKKKKLNPQPNFTMTKKTVKDFKEEAEQIDELSKGLVARYANKAAKTTQANYDKSKDKFQFSSGRQDGMKNAVKRLTKEEAEQIDESSLHRQHFQMVADLIRGHESAEKRKELAHHHAELFKKANPRFDHAKFMKAAGVNEEVQIDEISKSTLARYIPSAARDVGSHTYAGKEAGEWASHYTRAGDWSAAEKQSKKSYADFKKANKRIAGIDRATKKLAIQKEEKEIEDNEPVCAICGDEKGTKHSCCDEVKFMPKHEYDSYNEKPKKVNEAIAKKLPVQHAVDAVHATLGPKSATRFLSHLSPGTDKHTSWDKVNDALVKQGVQTHHIASIAQKTSHANVNESRGHKVLATFFKNREVAQRAYQGNPAKDAEVAQGGGSPADQGIAAAKRDAEDKKKVAESMTPAVHAATPKTTKKTAKEYNHAPIPGTKRISRAKSDSNEPGESLKEDQYTSEYKIKYFVDPITGESKTRKIRPHRIDFKASKMRGEPAQKDAQNDLGLKEGFDDYHAIAKELVNKHGKNVTAQHIKDFAGERDTHRGLDHTEVMHHVKKLSEDDMPKDEKWVEFKNKFKKGAK